MVCVCVWGGGGGGGGCCWAGPSDGQAFSWIPAYYYVGV